MLVTVSDVKLSKLLLAAINLEAVHKKKTLEDTTNIPKWWFREGNTNLQ